MCEAWTDFYCFLHIRSNRWSEEIESRRRKCLSISSRNFLARFWFIVADNSGRHLRLMKLKLERDLLREQLRYIIELISFRLHVKLATEAIMLWHQISLSNNWIMFEMHDNFSTWAMRKKKENINLPACHSTEMLAERQDTENLLRLRLAFDGEENSGKKKRKIVINLFWALEGKSRFYWCHRELSSVLQLSFLHRQIFQPFMERFQSSRCHSRRMWHCSTGNGNRVMETNKTNNRKEILLHRLSKSM